MFMLESQLVHIPCVTTTATQQQSASRGNTVRTPIFNPDFHNEAKNTAITGTAGIRTSCRLSEKPSQAVPASSF